VSCQLDALRRCLAPSVRRVLGELPETLDETYERILQEIPKSNRSHTHRLLQCLTVAIRPLFVEELAEVLAVDFSAAGGIPKLDEDLRWEDEEQAVLSACSSLVAVVAVQGSRVVQFSHFSVKEFLISDRLASKEDASSYHILLEPAHTIMAQACLGALIRLDDDVDEESISTFPLSRYAADHIGDHAEFGDVLSRIQDAIDYLLDPDNPHFAAWLWLRGNLGWGRFPEAVPLYYVAEFGFRGLVKHLVSKNPNDICSRGECGTPLHAALQEGHEDVSQLLLAHSVDINIRGSNGQTPLHLAAYEGFFEVTRTLIERDADVNVRCNKGKTPLHQALAGVYDYLDSKYFYVIRFLLKHGADVDAQDNHQSTPLHLACYEGCVKATQLLFEHGANVHVRDNNGRALLHEALGKKPDHLRAVLQPVLVMILLQRSADVNTQDNHLWTPLHLASSQGLLKAAQVLLEHGASVNLSNKQGQTPLHLAAKYGHPEMIQLLLDHVKDVDARDSDLWSPKLLAPYIGRPEVAQLLPGCRANANMRDDEGQTPLHTALETMRHRRSEKYCNVIRSLLKHHADVDAQNGDHLTPLQLSVCYGNAEGVQVLLEHGASVHVRNKWKTPLHQVLESGFPFWGHYFDVTQLLLVHGADVDSQDDGLLTPLHIASCKELLEVAKLLLEHGANVHMRNNDGRTPLHCASQYQHIDIVRLLLTHSADVGSRDHTQSTPLHLASCEGSLEVTRLLLEHGADVRVRDDKGGTPLHDATWGGYIEVMQLLLEKGADVDAQSNSGLSALHLASYEGDLEVVQLLLNHGANVDLQDYRGGTPFHVAEGRGVQEVVRLLSEHRQNDQTI
jgi:ankyrin repeat protein